jgi:hypothetical protein
MISICGELYVPSFLALAIYHAQKTTSARKAMRCVWATIYLEEEVGKSVGASTVL